MHKITNSHNEKSHNIHGFHRAVTAKAIKSNIPNKAAEAALVMKSSEIKNNGTK